MIDTPSKAAGVLVTYRPSEEQIRNVVSIAGQLDALYVVDNSEQAPESLSTIPLPSNVKLLSNGNRGGAAGALNIGTKQAIADLGACPIFLLDQDSSMPPGFFSAQLQFANEGGHLVVAPRYFDINSNTYGNYTLLSRWWMRNITGESMTEPFEVTFAITSGTLIWSETLKSAGSFREDYFIDHVDSEFCIRLQKLGLKVIINPGVTFRHAIGKRILRTFAGITFKPNFHPPYRRYYAVRNGVLLAKEYFLTFPSVLLLMILRIGYEYTGILLFENNRASKFKALVYGLIDAITNRTGPCTRSF